LHRIDPEERKTRAGRVTVVEDMREGRATTERRKEGDLRREDEDEARE